MLEKIKSKYLIPNIFSFVNKIRKCELVKYNKNLQNNFNINLIDYKNLSEKYIIYEENGKRKEYDLDGDLLFEGVYLKGKRNGEGKEYNLDGKIFEGEYLNGNKNGKGKEYYIDDKLKFEGEYLKGKRWNGKGYDRNNNIIYILKEGKGYVKEYEFDGGLEFEGEYLNGEKMEK